MVFGSGLPPRDFQGSCQVMSATLFIFKIKFSRNSKVLAKACQCSWHWVRNKCESLEPTSCFPRRSVVLLLVLKRPTGSFASTPLWIDPSAPLRAWNKRPFRQSHRLKRRVNHASLINLVCLSDLGCVSACAYIRTCMCLFCVKTRLDLLSIPPTRAQSWI